jgi:hypothetical protein
VKRPLRNNIIFAHPVCSRLQDHMVQLMLRFPYLQAEAEEYNTHTAEGNS